DAELSNKINYWLTKPGWEFKKAIGSFERALIDIGLNGPNMKLSPNSRQAECQLAVRRIEQTAARKALNRRE
ncbi:hypothetical protein Tco_0234123, partial [Tanacetum coccineum]